MSYCPFLCRLFVAALPDYARNSLQLLADAGAPLYGLLDFVDGTNELPMTLIVGPSNYDKQTTYGLEFGGDELLEPAQPVALTIVVPGIIPVTILSHVICSSERAKRGGVIDPAATFVHQPTYDTIRPHLRDAEARKFGCPGPEVYGSGEFQA